MMMSVDDPYAHEISKTYLNAFAFLATSLCKCTTAGAMLLMCDQVERMLEEGSWGSTSV
jgi:hypothetical protein